MSDDLCPTCHTETGYSGFDPRCADHWHREQDDKAEAPIPAADGGGQWTPDPGKPTHYTFGPLPAERTTAMTTAHVATFPDGSRVDLPAGTVLREGTGGLDPAHLLACARGVVDFATQEPIDGALMQALLFALRDACGDAPEDVALRVGPIPARKEAG